MWLPRNDNEKVKVLNTLVEHPEEIFFILVKDAYYSQGETSDYLINIAYDLMNRVIQEGNKQKPEGEEPEKKGTGFVVPPEKGQDIEDVSTGEPEDAEEEPEAEGGVTKRVKPATKKVKSPAEDIEKP